MKFYDRQGQSISFHQWGVLMNDDEYKRVALTEIGPQTVSTVWLGIDHGFGAGPPQIFETMVFTGWPSMAEAGEQVWRYATEAAALAGHDQVVTACQVAYRGPH